MGDRLAEDGVKWKKGAVVSVGSGSANPVRISFDISSHTWMDAGGFGHNEREERSY